MYTVKLCQTISLWQYKKIFHYVMEIYNQSIVQVLLLFIL